MALFHVREGDGRPNPILHLAFPLLTSAAVVWVGYKSLDPLPPSPVRWAAVAAGIWLVLGVALLFAVNRDTWAADARLALDERLALEPGVGGS